MLTSSFCCFEGVSVSAERRLWHAGCRSWRELLVLDAGVFSKPKLERVRAQVKQAMIALEAGLADYFLNRLRPPDTIRVLPHFVDIATYLDIETTGLAAKDRVTTVALVGGGRVQCYVRGLNLDELLRPLADLSMLVTYNGTGFDLPRLRRAFHIDLAVPHLDLRPCLEALGYRGGLKRCEELLGVRRGGTAGLTGEDAVELWRRYDESGDRESLVQLVRYNITDALSLELLAVEVYNRVMSCFPVALGLPRPERPDISALDLHDVL